VELLSTVVNAVTRRRPDRGSSGRPAVLAIDGRSNNGKSTLAARIVGLVPGSVVIHTDDIAWEHSRFGWADLLMDGILVPAHRGQAVSYRPPRWDEHGRQGSIDVPAGCPLLIIEGDGAGRREVAHLIDTVIWVQADEMVAAQRSAARAADPPAADLANQAFDRAPFDEDGWMAEEIPFNTAQRTWERADIIVCGTPEIPYDASTQIVIARPQAHPLPGSATDLGHLTSAGQVTTAPDNRGRSQDQDLLALRSLQSAGARYLSKPVIRSLLCRVPGAPPRAGAPSACSSRLCSWSFRPPSPAW